MVLVVNGRPTVAASMLPTFSHRIGYALWDVIGYFEHFVIITGGGVGILGEGSTTSSYDGPST